MSVQSERELAQAIRELRGEVRRFSEKIDRFEATVDRNKAIAIRNGHGDHATKADIRELWTAIESIRSELAIIRWVVGIQSAVTLATFAIVAAKLLWNRGR